jgi:UrcA family protein
MSSSSRAGGLRRNLALAFLGGFAALGVMASAYADDPNQVDQITVYAPAVKIVGHSESTLAPIVQRTATVRVHFDPPTLTTNSGRALLDDSVHDAARQACDSAAPLSPSDGACIRDAVNSAQPQVETAIAQAQTADEIQQRRLSLLFAPR